MQAGADMVGHVAESARAAAESLDQNAPQLAGLMRTRRGFSEGLRDQTVDDLLKTASDFTRKQPAVVFGLASLVGFVAFRVLKSSTPEFSREPERSWEHEMSGRSESGSKQLHSR